MAAGSCLTSALVAFTYSLHTPPGISAVEYNQTAHFMHSLFIQQKHIECFSICQGPCLPRAVVERSVRTRTVSILFIYVSPAATESLAQKGCSKTFISINITVVTGIIITAHPSAMAQKEAGHEGIQEAETCALLFLLPWRHAQGPCPSGGASSSSGHYAQACCVWPDLSKVRRNYNAFSSMDWQAPAGTDALGRCPWDSAWGGG